MNIRSFLKLVEIQTKAASMIPLLLGTVYSLYRFKTFNLRNFAFMFVSLLTFDMVTTAVNNYMDFKKAKKTHGYGYETHNAIVKYKLKEFTVLTVIFLLLTIAVVFGVLLFLNTDIIILLLGALSFAVGISYSFGPIPISRTPFGELFSGLFMGFVIVFISVYIHIFDQNVLNIVYSGGNLSLSIGILEILYIFLLSIPAVSGIANIMLANNICDIEDDRENRRYTLPIYIGRENSLKLFRSLYYIAFAVVILLVILGIEPISCLLVLVTLIPVNKNLKTFDKLQTKKDTFPLSVKNFVMMNVTLIVTIAVALLWK
ncbi:1,4-dihydroxy-2-naphthoate polyprenyltransferase [Clostridium thermarum]|uniref:1,4-dihydroxy-2-naphthoate polyprenyltransferase n=1 Tax=Clostridium thermarum TaxID=1716543 RepID=UPI0011242F65|nr:1,4-dihydroxy-2-naphthoate polyprenyltransferase [Clostridium thermarum]